MYYNYLSLYAIRTIRHDFYNSLITAVRKIVEKFIVVKTGELEGHIGDTPKRL